MRVEVIMPRMGQSMEEGRILRWLKSVGDEVQRGEVIAEIETDKADVEMEAFASGVLVEIVRSEGETAPTGEVIAIIDDVSSVTCHVSGEEAEQAAVERRVSVSPVARKLAEKHGIDLDQVLGTGPGGRIVKEDVEALIAASSAPQPQDERVKASPAARRLAHAHGIDLRELTGTGPAGRIVKADVEAWSASQQKRIPSPDVVEGVRRVPLSRIRQTTARRMVESKTTVPHFYISMDIEMSRALALRDWLKGRDVDVSVNDLILKATALTLADYPHLNATFAGDELHLHQHINLAVAVALDDGLITPVIQRCEELSLSELAAASRQLIERARTGRLRPEDLEGGTFTVSNLGMFGVKHFEAIINPPQAAILGVGAVRRVPVFDAQDRVVPAQLMTATVSADHRVTDGAEVARFLAQLKQTLEDAFGLVVL